MFAKLILGVVAKRLDGYKTYIGGVGLIAIGVAGLIGHYWPNSALPNADPEKSLDMIAMGWMAIGFRHKMEKQDSGKANDIAGSSRGE